MHIPDGYLSPSTCIALYAAAAPFWYSAFRRVKSSLQQSAIPLLSAFSACAFVIMMFNLPLPGGTSGHAVGMAVSAIILGPWASIITISIALFIQAVFFGDGGITTFGANSFNMAIVGSLVAIVVYRIVSRRTPLNSPRRVFAAALAGYLAINASALVAAIEFGIQPALFHDSSGTPLYAFYPLSVAVPAMMIGHLTLAGFAEAIISGGVVAYFQRTDVSQLQRSAPEQAVASLDPPRSSWRSARPIWLALTLLLILTPLGLLAGASAWGEWSAADFEDTHARSVIANSSLSIAPPERAPQGLARLATFWTAPIPDYAPPFLRSATFGYLMSGMLGSGLVIGLCLLLGRALRLVSMPDISSTNLGEEQSSKFFGFRRPAAPVRIENIRKRRRLGHSGGVDFLFRTLRDISERWNSELSAEELAQQRGFMQSLDPRARIVCVISILCAVVASRNLIVITVLLAIALLIAVLSHVPLLRLLFRASIGVVFFTWVIAIPAIFITPGRVVFELPILNLQISAQGIRAMTFLTGRAGVSILLSLLLVLTTRWTHVLKALRSLGIPAVVVGMLGMTHRYVFLMIQTARDIFESRQSRLVGRLSPADGRRIAVSGAGVLLSKSFDLGSEVHLAMMSRGYRGEPKVIHEFSMRFQDWLALIAFVGIAAIALWLGRTQDTIFL